MTWRNLREAVQRCAIWISELRAHAHASLDGEALKREEETRR